MTDLDRLAAPRERENNPRPRPPVGPSPDRQGWWPASRAGTEPDATAGIHRKYEVRRVSDPTGKHLRCEYFVLDRAHDKYAEAALRAYAESCRDEYPELAADILRGLDEGNPWFPEVPSDD